MATNFPASLDVLTNPQPGDALNNPSHSAQHHNANDAIEALEAKVGVDGSAVTTSIDYKLRNLTGSVVDQLEENWNIAAVAATGTVNMDVKTASIWYYTTNASANFTLNIRGDASTSIDSLVAVNDSLTVVFAVTNGATAYRPTVIQVDGVAVTPKWQGGTAPSAGNTNSIDVYSFVIIKTAAATFTVLGSQTKFA